MKTVACFPRHVNNADMNSPLCFTDSFPIVYPFPTDPFNIFVPINVVTGEIETSIHSEVK